jgi:hypothetical protein
LSFIAVSSRFKQFEHEILVRLHHVIIDIICLIFRRSSWSPFEKNIIYHLRNKFRLNFSTILYNVKNFVCQLQTLFHRQRTSKMTPSPFFKKHKISPLIFVFRIIRGGGGFQFVVFSKDPQRFAYFFKVFFLIIS